MAATLDFDWLKRRHRNWNDFAFTLKRRLMYWWYREESVVQLCYPISLKWKLKYTLTEHTCDITCPESILLKGEHI